MSNPILHFAGALRRLLNAPTPEAFEHSWHVAQLSDLGWQALHRAWRHDEHYGEPALDTSPEEGCYQRGSTTISGRTELAMKHC